VYRLLPLDESNPATKTKIEIRKMENYLNNYKPVFIKTPDNNYTSPVSGLHYKLFEDIINKYLSLGDSAHAKQWAKKYLAYPETKILKPEFYNLYTGEMLIRAGLRKEGTAIIENVGRFMYKQYKNYEAFEPWSSDYLGMIDYARINILGKFDIQSKVLDDIIEELKKEKDNKEK
jgi:hypothetical protein